MSVLVCLALIAAACTQTAGQGGPTTTAGDDSSSPESTESPDSIPPESQPDGEGQDTIPNFGSAAEGLGDLTGQLAVTTDSGELWVMGPDGFDPRLVAGGSGVRATQPTWVPNVPALAFSYFGADRQGIGYDGIEIGGSTFSEVPGNPVYYLQWSPTGSGLAYLRASPDQRNTEFGLAGPGEAGVALDRGAPFYLDWGPTGEAIATHVDAQRVDVWDTVDRTVARLFETETLFVAPVYLSPSVLLSAREGAVTLSSVSTGSTVSVLGRGEGWLRFVPSPDGAYVAYAGGGGDQGLKIVEVATASEFEVTSEVAFSWEWSADGNRLAWLGADQGDLAQWHFFDLEFGDEIGASQPYEPTSYVANAILPFAAQYALSHSRWSPDGTGFAYAGQAADGLVGIWVELVDSDQPPTLVSPGNFVTWSSSPEGSGGGRSPV